MSNGGVMAGKRGLIMGVANDRSLAWGIAKAVADAGGELAFTYQGEALEKRVRPLAESVGAKLVLPCDVTSADSMDATFKTLKDEWGTMDFAVHAIAYSDKTELRGRYADTSRENFQRSLDISCFSFTDMCRRAGEIMPNGGSLLTLTYLGGRTRCPPLQRHGRCQGRAGSQCPLPGARLRQGRHSREFAVRWASKNAGGLWHR